MRTAPAEIGVINNGDGAATARHASATIMLTGSNPTDKDGGTASAGCPCVDAATTRAPIATPSRRTCPAAIPKCIAPKLAETLAKRQLDAHYVPDPPREAFFLNKIALECAGKMRMWTLDVPMPVGFQAPPIWVKGAIKRLLRELSTLQSIKELNAPPPNPTPRVRGELDGLLSAATAEINFS